MSQFRDKLSYMNWRSPMHPASTAGVQSSRRPGAVPGAALHPWGETGPSLGARVPGLLLPNIPHLLGSLTLFLRTLRSWKGAHTVVRNVDPLSHKDLGKTRITCPCALLEF